jgi:hypothetical protein
MTVNRITMRAIAKGTAEAATATAIAAAIAAVAPAHGLAPAQKPETTNGNHQQHETTHRFSSFLTEFALTRQTRQERQNRNSHRQGQFAHLRTFSAK